MLFVEVSGLLPMCGHGTIGVATVLVETGMVAVSEPETVIRLDTPAGLVEATVTVSDGRAERVRLRNVPAFVAELDATVEVESLGALSYDMAFGGNFYALDARRIGRARTRPRERAELIDRGLEIISAINARGAAGPSGRSRDRRLQARRLPRARDETARDARERDRRSTPAGSTARRAEPAPRHAWRAPRSRRARDRSGVRQRVDHRQPVHGPPARGGEVGSTPAVVPEVSGRAWITGMSQYLLDPTDPFPAGFAL